MGIIELASWLSSLVIAFLYYSKITTYLERFFPSLGIWTVPLGFVLAIVLARIVIGLVTSFILSNISRGAHRHSFNKALGILPGLLTGIIWAAIISVLLLAIPINKNIAEATRDSRVAAILTTQLEKLEEKLSPVFDEAIKRSVNRLTIEPGSDKAVKLPYTVKKAEARPDLEAEMLQLVNKERIKHGLQPLKTDPELVPVARKHSADMFARGYFSHITPEGRDPFQRIRAAKVRFLAAGENLALAQTLAIAHYGLMKSPGHRANILNPAFGRVGIGILDGGIYGLMITQNFRN
jgi:uncharacterized protein YkwD